MIHRLKNSFDAPLMAMPESIGIIIEVRALFSCRQKFRNGWNGFAAPLPVASHIESWRMASMSNAWYICAAAHIDLRYMPRAVYSLVGHPCAIVVQEVLNIGNI